MINNLQRFDATAMRPFVRFRRRAFAAVDSRGIANGNGNPLWNPLLPAQVRKTPNRRAATRSIAVQATTTKNATTTTESLMPRSHYPCLARVAYLNQASLGLVGAPAVDAMHSFLDTTGRHGNLHLSDDDEVALLEGLRHRAAKLMGCSKHQLAILSSASEMLGQLPMMMLGDNQKSHAPADRIVAVSTDFPALTRPWLKYVQDHGHCSEIVFVDDRPDQDLTEQLITAIHNDSDSDSETKTSVVAVSYVQYGTGSRIHVPRLREATHRVGARLVLDATQAAGILPMEAQAWKADVVVSSGYKWLGGHGGVAIAALSEDLLTECGLPPLPGWMGTPNPFSFEPTQLPVAPDARRFTQSTMSYLSVVGLEAALGDLLPLLEEGLPERHAFNLAGELVEGLESRKSPWRPFRSPVASSVSAAPHIVSLGCDGDENKSENKSETKNDDFVTSTVEALRNNNVFCGVRNGRIRVSLAPYNNSDDVAVLLSVLAPPP